jgi:hypothetical protein
MFPQFNRVGSFEIAFGALATSLLLGRSHAEKTGKWYRGFPLFKNRM